MKLRVKELPTHGDTVVHSPDAPKRRKRSVLYRPVTVMFLLLVCLSLVPVQFNLSYKYKLFDITQALRLEIEKSSEELELLRTKLGRTMALVVPRLPIIHATILVRIYPGDKAKWSAEELGQWFEYLRYAGVSHIYLYDNYLEAEESLEEWVKIGGFSKYVTYHDWSEFQPYSIRGTQIHAYRHSVEHYGNLSQWHMSWDMDEYPYSQVDTAPGFLTRILYTLGANFPEVSQFCCSNYLFLGQGDGDDMVIARYVRRTSTPGNNLVKPIFKPMKALVNVHRHNMLEGKTKNIAPSVLRINHYWGARLQEWGDDTPEIIEKTEEDKGMLLIANELRVKN